VDALVTKDPFLGRVIAGKYEILKRLGAGGMGAVYHARHKQTGGDCAIKFLHGTAIGDESAVKRFQLEAQNAAALRHTNTIRVTDFGVDEGLLYLVMEYLEGASLADVIQRDGPMPWRRAVHILRQVLKSLWEAHEHARRIIHRDIKPANIFLVDLPGDPDQVRVLDFGIARALAGSGAGTQGLLGTPFYMAPELWRGEPVDARTDLYAVGCVAFQLLAGTPPFVPPPSATESIFPLLDMHLNVPAPELDRVARGVPGPIASWVATLLAKDRALRPPSARAALEALDAAAAEAEAGADLHETLDAPRPEELPVDRPLPTATIIGQRPRPVARATPRGSSPRARPSRASWLVPTIVAVLLVAGVVTVALLAGRGGRADADATPIGGEPVAGGNEPDPLDEPVDPLEGGDQPEGPVVEPMPTFHPQFGSYVGSYVTRLSAADHEAYDGQTLLRPADILVRDRERYHAGQGDLEDGFENVLGTPEAREQARPIFERFVDATLAHSIITGTPRLEVGVYQQGLVLRVLPE